MKMRVMQSLGVASEHPCNCDWKGTPRAGSKRDSHVIKM